MQVSAFAAQCFTPGELFEEMSLELLVPKVIQFLVSMCTILIRPHLGLVLTQFPQCVDLLLQEHNELGPSVLWSVSTPTVHAL